MLMLVAIMTSIMAVMAIRNDIVTVFIIMIMVPAAVVVAKVVAPVTRRKLLHGYSK